MYDLGIIFCITSFFRRDTQGRRGGGVALYVKKWIDCKKLPMRNSHDQTESLWVTIRDQTNNKHLEARIYYRPTDKGEPGDKTSLLLLTGSIEKSSITGPGAHQCK